VVSLASEFPNDNPALHSGAVWVCLDPCGRPVVEHPPSRLGAAAIALAPSVLDDVGDEENIVVEELEPIDAALEGFEAEVTAQAEPEPIARACESEPPPASGMMMTDPFAVLSRTLAEVLESAGAPQLAEGLPEMLEGMPVARAWREILRGTSDDFGACGSAMLDEWAAELLAGLLDAPTRASSLRQELRSRGIAAFGLAA
jgi:hypothetical protein